MSVESVRIAIEEATIPRGPMRSRGRPSLVDEVAKVTAVFEQQIQELTALVASMREETTALRAEMALKEARLEEAAVSFQAAIDAKDAVITTQAAQIADLTAKLQAKEDLYKTTKKEFQQLMDTGSITRSCESLEAIGCIVRFERIINQRFGLPITELIKKFDRIVPQDFGRSQMNSWTFLDALLH